MNAIKTTLLLGGLTLLFIYGGAALGGRGGMMFAFLLAMGMNFFAYFYSDKLILRMYKAREVTETDAPWLYEIVRNLARQAHIPMPKVYMIPGDQPNAFATGRSPSHAAIAVTQGITSILDKEELTGVLAHEMAHVINRDILIGTIAATFAGALSMIANMAQWSMLFGGREGRRGNPIGSIAMMIIAPIAASLVQMAISRTREYAADRTGAELMGNPEPLASALAKLHNASRKIPMKAEPATAHMFIVSPLSGQSLAGLFSTHPPIEKRIAALREMRHQ